MRGRVGARLPARTTANHEAADTSNLNATCAGTTKPAGTSYGLPNGSKEVEGGKGERDKRASGSVAPSSDNDGGDEVHHMYAVPNSTPPPPNPDEHQPPPSMPPEGENCGE
ncbi:hypothetical protein PAXRUDRAFT_19792 [Paxillus rubicundulus Ve08.2h10]|uniref:Uncharacterized protein n=1 Tax=Paxillus rubicundulus Ve08.2h10 TaxID=930991 RepID=A0A0D0DBB8_9AGAM|nr:hypothetical protein PAXRUDRAFT_19792 [Paxillus rubicundulus Ve08.2h10]